MNHKTKLIQHEDMEAEVDLKIADLILNLWKLDLTTTNSCQDNNPKDWIWIEFASTLDAEQFLNICANEYSDDVDSLYNRIRQEWDGAKDSWKYSTCIDDYNVHQEIDEEDDSIIEISLGKPDFMFSMSIRFPAYDLKEVERLVNEELTNLSIEETFEKFEI